MKDQDIPWRDMIAVLYRRRRFIARLSVLGTAAVALGLFLVGPRYQATATLRVTAQRPPAISAQPGSASEPAQVSDEELNSEATLLQSDDLVREVLESFKDAHTQPPEGLLKTVLAVPVELLGSAYRALHGVPAQSSLDRWVEHTRKHLEVELVKKSSLIAVSYGDRAVDPEWTAKTGEQSGMEQSMLDFANDVEANSRLSCQIKVTDELDGLIVRVPERQA